MSKTFLMGNEAIGLGAIRAGVQVVSGYPGTPSTEILETVAKHNPGDVYVEWSVNEKAGMEVAAAAAYLEAHVQQQVTLDALAGAAGLGKYRLLRAFARERGISPYRYLEALRVARAQALLQQGLPPAEAALEVGFADQSHLCNAFRQRTGLTPGQYRKAFQEGEEHG